MTVFWIRAGAFLGLTAVALGAFGAHALKNRLDDAAGGCFLLGTLVFSGSLYTMSLTGARWLGAVTPLGGLLLIAGWACLLLARYR